MRSYGAAMRHGAVISSALHRAPTPTTQRRTMCAALDSFSELMQRGLGLRERFETHQEPICEALSERGWYALDGLLSEDAALHVRSEAATMHEDGTYTLSYSRVAETGEKIFRPNVYMRELDGESWRVAPTTVVLVSELMQALPSAINRGFDALSRHQHPRISSSIFGHKLAVSVADGAFYPKHLDNVGSDGDLRKLTAVYYMNAGWDADNQGGEIRMYDALAEQAFTSIAPVGGGGVDRLILFWSDLMVHEVLPMRVAGVDGSEYHRHTFTVWLTTENGASLADALSPLYPLRMVHYPDKGR